MLESLKDEVCRANLHLVENNLVTLTWGNVSGIDREEGLVVIKPSGVDYAEMKPDDMVVVDLEGHVVEGHLRPSSDTPTHLLLYQAFPDIGGVTHTHSTFATMFAQAERPIPCYGTTHADHFHGAIPVTRRLKEAEVQEDYEENTGRVIIERFVDMVPEDMPAVLVAGHGPFAWGKDAAHSVKHSIILEEVAKMAIGTVLINPESGGLPDYILKKHYSRKHGPDAYYGQEENDN